MIHSANSRVIETVVFANIKTFGSIVHGQLIYQYKQYNRKHKLVGSYVHDRYLSLHYRNAVGANLQHGHVVMKLNGNADRLIGTFVGVGPVSGEIITGQIELAKLDLDG